MCAPLKRGELTLVRSFFSHGVQTGEVAILHNKGDPAACTNDPSYKHCVLHLVLELFPPQSHDQWSIIYNSQCLRFWPKNTPYLQPTCEKSLVGLSFYFYTNIQHERSSKCLSSGPAACPIHDGLVRLQLRHVWGGESVPGVPPRPCHQRQIPCCHRTSSSFLSDIFPRKIFYLASNEHLIFETTTVVFIRISTHLSHRSSRISNQ